MKLNQSIAAVVTGGGSGLGEAAARALASHGVRVAIFDLNRRHGEDVAASIGGIYCEVDVRSEQAVADAFSAAREVHGQERVLVNCAGIGGAMKTAARDRKSGAIRMHPVGAFDQALQINLVGTFRCIAHATSGMLSLDPLEDGERGVVVNTASIASEDGQMGQAAYAASKGGVVAMTLPIARDFMGDGIRVNTISPGLFNTPLLQSAPEDLKATLAAQVPFPKRLGEPAEFASLVVEIARNSYVNAAHYRLDGALRMAPR